MPVHEVDRPEFWEGRYRNGSDPWDLGGPTPQFLALLQSADAPPPGRLIVPGCGRGYDAILFAQSGFDVVAVDFAEQPITAARALAEQAGVQCQFLQEDFFALPAIYRGTFDYLLEYTCYCAIDPARRPEYVDLASNLLRPGGQLIGLFFPLRALSRSQFGPPYPVSEEEIREQFGSSFTVEVLALSTHSVAGREGLELFARFRRR